ncbi:PQ loop repeat-domain-containing protein [Gigaspora rosea]|uniref:PQ loop repeat-domain-containing protein n=1 Tax=Gigaspora rosea TaxID=44941 RepID=A0A397U5F9_9GLOM|nr:PQ loop repeat-domain-containing protein [Gigaspora rosea]
MFSECEPVSEDGYPYVRWIHFLFGACVYGNQGIISFILGRLKVRACWLCAQFPQIITNYRNKSADGLSIYFLLNWFLGDLTNLVGCILTKQLPFQVYLAIYFCSVDCGLFFQFIYYSWFYPSNVPLPDDYVPIGPDPEIPKYYSMNSLNSLRNSIIEGAKKSYTSSMVFVVLLFTFHSTSVINSSFSTSHPNRHMFIGRIMAWSCTVLYLTSRMPQIWKNYTRRSVEGLSIFMFIFAALGNLTYTSYIFTSPSASKDPSFLPEAVPYILGSVGTLSFDFVVFLQWLMWRDPENRKFRRSQHYSENDIEYQQVPNVRSNRNSRTFYDHRRSDYIIDDVYS